MLQHSVKVWQKRDFLKNKGTGGYDDMVNNKWQETTSVNMYTHIKNNVG